MFVAPILGLELAVWMIAVPIPVRLPADVDDVYALRTNPAGLGFLKGEELRLVYGRSAPSTADLDAINGGAVFAAANLFNVLTLGGAFELDVFPQHGHTSSRTSLGLAFGGQKTAFGIAYEHFSPVDQEGKNALSTGLTVRPGSWISAGIDVRDIGQNLGPRLYDLGLAFRPVTDRVLISARWRLQQGRDVFGSAQDFAGRAEVEAIEGVLVGGGANLIFTGKDTNVGAFGQISLVLEHLGVGTSYQDTTVSNDLSVELAYRSKLRPTFFAQRRVAVLDLEGDLVPETSFNLLSRSFEISSYGAVPLLLDSLARSERDLGVLLRIAPLSIGWGRASEIRRLILALRAADRRVDCELTGSSDLDYFVASACTTIIVAPAMTIELNGVAANVLFFGDALEKVGVKVDYVARGKYKSAPEQFTRTGMSDPQRESLNAYLDRVYDSLVSAIADGRKLERSKVEEIIARGSVTASEAVSLKLVDKLIYPEELDDHMNSLYGRNVSFQSASGLHRAARPRWAPYPRIAIVNIDAAISGGESRNLPLGIGQTSGAQTLISALDAARTDSSVVAVVLRVDSPGGDALASDLIAHAVKLTNADKPVIASFGDVAASGGYYVAANARAIYAEPTTITGSIGVFSLKVSIPELLGKLGVNVDSIEKGPLSNEGSIYSEMTPAERAVLQRQVDDAYDKFLEVVAKGRSKSKEAVREVAEGRVWSGEAAKTNGLVDEIGGLVEAVKRAKKEAGLAPDAKVEIVSLPSNREPLPDVVRTGLAEVLGGTPPPESRLGDLVPHALKPAVAAVISRRLDHSKGALAIVPFGLDID
jgi:protease-4